MEEFVRVDDDVNSTDTFSNDVEDHHNLWLSIHIDNEAGLAVDLGGADGKTRGYFAEDTQQESRHAVRTINWPHSGFNLAAAIGLQHNIFGQHGHQTWQIAAETGLGKLLA